MGVPYLYLHLFQFLKHINNWATETPNAYSILPIIHGCFPTSEIIHIAIYVGLLAPRMDELKVSSVSFSHSFVTKMLCKRMGWWWDHMDAEMALEIARHWRSHQRKDRFTAAGKKRYRPNQWDTKDVRSGDIFTLGRYGSWFITPNVWWRLLVSKTMLRFWFILQLKFRLLHRFELHQKKQYLENVFFLYLMFKNIFRGNLNFQKTKK